MMNTYVAPSRVNKRSVSVWLEKDQVKELKMSALHEDMSIQEFLELAIESACEDSAKRRRARDVWNAIEPPVGTDRRAAKV